MEDKILIYADGACRNNQSRENIGAIGVVLLYNGKEKYIKEAYENTTNNQMEILAAIRGLESLKRFDIPVEIYSDSQYVVATMNDGWKRNANKELWSELDALLSQFTSVKFIKVSGHSDDKYNNLADKLCNEIMNTVSKK